MCGRHTFAGPMDAVADHFQLTDPPKGLAPRYNVAPGQAVAVVALKSDGERFGLAHLKWGLVPDWAENPDRGIRPVNARDDSVGKPMFARLFATQRCLLPATGFYEWRVTGRRKEPVHFSLTGGGLMAFAGLWSLVERRHAEGADGLPHHHHAERTGAGLPRPHAGDRPPQDYRRWLSNDTPEKELKAMLRPYPAEVMTARLANPAVNKATVEGPECLMSADSVPSQPAVSSVGLACPAHSHRVAGHLLCLVLRMVGVEYTPVSLPPHRLVGGVPSTLRPNNSADLRFTLNSPTSKKWFCKLTGDISVRSSSAVVDALRLSPSATGVLARPLRVRSPSR